MRVAHGLKAVAAGAFVVLTAIGVHLGAQGRGRPIRSSSAHRPIRRSIARGQAIYGIRCAGCHGADLRGGDQGGPNLLRSEVVLTDTERRGHHPDRPERPSDTRHARDAAGAAAAGRHHSPSPNTFTACSRRAGRQGRPPESATAPVLNVLVGDIEAGRAYFNAKCSSCHSVTGDLKGIASRVTDPKRCRTSGCRAAAVVAAAAAATGSRAVRVTVTPAGGAPVEGRLVTDRRLHRHARAGRWHAAHLPEKRR